MQSPKRQKLSLNCASGTGRTNQEQSIKRHDTIFNNGKDLNPDSDIRCNQNKLLILDKILRRKDILGLIMASKFHKLMKY